MLHKYEPLGSTMPMANRNSKYKTTTSHQPDPGTQRPVHALATVIGGLSCTSAIFLR